MERKFSTKIHHVVNLFIEIVFGKEEEKPESQSCYFGSTAAEKT